MLRAAGRRSRLSCTLEFRDRLLIRCSRIGREYGRTDPSADVRLVRHRGDLRGRGGAVLRRIRQCRYLCPLARAQATVLMGEYITTVALISFLALVGLMMSRPNMA